MQEVAGWMIVRRNERIGHVDAMVPCLVPMGERAACRGVQEVRVDVVLEDLHSSLVSVDL